MSDLDIVAATKEAVRLELGFSYGSRGEWADRYGHVPAPIALEHFARLVLALNVMSALANPRERLALAASWPTPTWDDDDDSDLVAALAQSISQLPTGWRALSLSYASPLSILFELPPVIGATTASVSGLIYLAKRIVGADLEVRAHRAELRARFDEAKRRAHEARRLIELADPTTGAGERELLLAEQDSDYGDKVEDMVDGAERLRSNGRWVRMQGALLWVNGEENAP